MAISRRDLLAAAAGAAAIAGLGRPAGAAPGRAAFVSAKADAGGTYFAAGFDAAGRRSFEVALPGRGHGAAVDPTGRHCVVFARRPGRFAVVIDLERNAVGGWIEALDGRHFYGHGVFSPDGARLYTTENDFEAGRGVIGVRDPASGYRPLGEIDSHGVGPHEVRLMGDGRTLVVANGGIRTHPETGRRKLNLPDMAPSLAYIDRRDGRLLARLELPRALHLLSIRHLAVGAGDAVGIAMQYQGPTGDTVPLVGFHGREGAIELAEAPAPVNRRMRNYCGSAAVDAGGRVLAVSAPRGNLVTFWSLAERRFLGHVAVEDGCGVAAAGGPHEFMISSGAGDVFRYDAATGRLSPVASAYTAAARWDNHLLRIGA